MALVFQDLFTGTNGQILGDRAGWLETGNTTLRNSQTIQSNKLFGTGASATVQYGVYADAGANDHWASFEVDGSFPVNANSFYPFITPNGASNPVNYVRVRVIDVNTVSVRAETSADGRIVNVNLNSTTSDASGFPLVSGDRIEVRRVGNTLDVYKNASDGVGGIHLNASLPIDVSGTTVGLPETPYSGFTDETGGSIDDFRIGTFSSPASIDNIDTDNQVTDGQGTATLEVSGFSGDITTITVSDGTYTSPNLLVGGTGTSYTWNVTDFTNQEGDSAVGQPNWFTGSLELTAGDGVDTASLAFSWIEATDWVSQSLTDNTIGKGSIAEGRPSGAYSNGSVAYYDTTKCTVDSEGLISTSETTDFKLYVWDIDTGTVEQITVIVQEDGNYVAVYPAFTDPLTQAFTNPFIKTFRK